GAQGTQGPWDEAAATAAVTSLPMGYLADFDDCSGLLNYYQANALELVTPYGLGGFGGGWASSEGGAMEDSAAAAGDAAQGGGDGGAPEHSSTNVQEEGVDEADI